MSRSAPGTLVMSPASTASGEHRPSLDDRVRLEQIRALYEELPFSALGMMLGGLIVISGLWASTVPRALMLVWIALIAANQTWRLTLFRQYRRNPPSVATAAGWTRRWALGALISGLTWGSSAIFMFDPDNASFQAYLVICLVGVTAGALALVTIHLRSFIFFVVPTLAPITVRLIAEGDRMHYWMGAVCALVLLVLIKFGLKLNRELETSLYNRFELDDQRHIAEAARSEAEIATQAKSKFLQATSHDLRNDVQAITLIADGLEHECAGTEAGRRIAAIGASARTLGRLADDLLSISRLDAGDIRPVITGFALQWLFEAIDQEFQPLAAQHRIGLQIEPTELRVSSDRMLLERIVRNFVSNALRYTPAHGQVTVTARPVATGALIEVRDSGIGIAASEHRSIFEEFYQVEGRGQPNAKGLGIGLSIVRRFADLLGHRIGVESAPGKGSCFFVQLALASASDDVAAAARYATIPNILQSRVLALIDDDPVILSELGSKLASWGLRVVAGTTCASVLEQFALEQQVPDLALVDYRLGDQATGIDSVDRLRSHFGSALPAVMLTGHGGDEHLAPAAARGMPVLEKPVRLGRLRLVLEGCLKDAQSRTEG